MSKTLAAGLIIYRRLSGAIEYLLLQTSYGDHHWTPPKGHVDEGEVYFEAAIRETQEEAGLEEGVHFKIPNKNLTIDCNYAVKGKPKQVLYWLAEVNDPNVPVVLSEEHQALKWLKLDDACEIVHYEEMKKVLKEAENAIQAQ